MRMNQYVLQLGFAGRDFAFFWSKSEVIVCVGDLFSKQNYVNILPFGEESIQSFIFNLFVFVFGRALCGLWVVMTF